MGRSGTRSTAGVSSNALETGGNILVITTGRGEARTEVGIAALDIRCPYLILCQISDSQTYASALSKLYLFDPGEVLMPDTMCERATSRSVLYRSIETKFPDSRVTPISRIHFNDTNGLERIKTFCAPEYSSVDLFVKENHYMETISLRETDTDDVQGLTYTHRVQDGVAPIDDYGIVLAQPFALPDLVTEKARRYAADRLLTADPLVTKSIDSETMRCYDVVIRMYELLKTENFHRDRVTNLLECIGKVEAQEPREESVEEANTVRNKFHVEQKKKDEDASDPLIDNEIVPSKGTFDANKLNLLRTNAGFEEVHDSSTTTISYKNVASPTESLPKQSSIRNFECGPSDLNPRRSSIITSFNYSSFASMVTGNTLSELGRQPSASIDLNVCSMASPVTVLSFPLADELPPMQMSITTERSAETLFEYCLSDDDFEPS